MTFVVGKDGVQESWKAGCNAKRHGKQRTPLYARRGIELLQVQDPAPEDPVVAEEDTSDGARDHGVAGEKAEHKGDLAREGPPGANGEREEEDEEAAAAVGEALRCHVHDVVDGRQDVGQDVYNQRTDGQHQCAQHAEHWMPVTEDGGKLPYSAAEGYFRGSGNPHSDKEGREERHRHSHCLSPDLILLRGREAAKVANVQQQR
mmetsp:Transcript_35161/g.49041  ORF Transcript_35161/g.49041 Transcript_35161/m.49041 type:complete len:204 (+) Transcript_35161:121-732(+)